MTGALSKTSPNIITNAIAVAQREGDSKNRRETPCKQRKEAVEIETFFCFSNEITCEHVERVAQPDDILSKLPMKNIKIDLLFVFSPLAAIGLNCNP